MVGPLVDAQRQHDAELGGDGAEVLDRRVALDRAGPVEVLGEHVLAEVRALEQLGDEDELAPSAAALRTSRSAVATLASTSSTIAIWIAATVSPMAQL